MASPTSSLVLTPSTRDLPVDMSGLTLQSPASPNSFSSLVSRSQSEKPGGSTKPSHNDTFPFRRLPVELQLLIYQHAFAQDDPINLCSRLQREHRGRYQHYIHDGASRLRKPAWGGMNMHRSGFGLRKEIERLRRTYIYFPYYNNPCANFMEKEEPRQLPLTLLHILKRDARLAAEAFYSANTFRFPHMQGWAALESFLNTIGADNCKHLRSLEVHVPLWCDGMNLDNLQVAWIDASHKQTRLIPIQTPPRDRHLGALRTCCLILGKLGTLQQISLILPSGSVHKWMIDDEDIMEGMLKDKRDRYMKRKAEEIQIFEKLSAALPKLKITLLVQPATDTQEKEAFRDYELFDEKAKERGWNLNVAPVRNIPHGNPDRR